MKDKNLTPETNISLWNIIEKVSNYVNQLVDIRREKINQYEELVFKAILDNVALF
jgi:hypothetical protein